MNNSTIIAVGNIVRDIKNGTRYRVIAIVNNFITLCEMDIKQLRILTQDIRTIVNLVNDKSLILENDEVVIFDKNQLSDSVRRKFEWQLQMMYDVMNTYGPAFTELCGRKTKPEIKMIMEKYNCPKTTFWRVCTSYFQSGMKDYSIVDSKAFGVNKGKQYSYSSKPGKKSEYFESTGVVLSDEIIGYFEEALKEYKAGRQKTINSAYDKMNMLHFTRTEMIDGVTNLVLLPESQRPTKRQFSYYVSQHLTKQEKDLIKTSAAEQRNNKRLIISDSLDGVYGPGDMVEIDACEADVSLVSSYDSNKTIGRPIVYFMVDVYTRIILAVSVAFDNNSVLGVTNLFLNLADDKKEYCSRYGMGFNDDAMWPSNIIPRRIRVDRGSEFRSKEFERICDELGIEKQLVPGASGSLKGIVEQSFHQMHSRQNVHLENYGLIEKRYDSEHHKEATLNIEQYTKMIINFVLMHNQQYDANYPLTRDMLEKGVQPIPAFLWQYGVNKYGQPRPIPVKEQYLFNLMTPVKAKISRRGICYKDLWYFAENDPILSRDMFNAGTKKVPYEVRMDMRDISNVYYLRNGKLMIAPLNKNLAGNADYAGLTMKEWEDYRAAKKLLDAKGRVHNDELSAFNFGVNNQVVNEGKKESYSDNKNMRPAREREKQEVSSKGKISTRLEIENTEDIAEVLENKSDSKNKQKPKSKRPSNTEDSDILDVSTSFEEAFDNFFDDQD